MRPAGAPRPTYGWRTLFLSGGGAIVAALYVWWCVPESAAWRGERLRASRAMTGVSVRDPTLLLWSGPRVALCFAYAGPFGAYFPALYPTRVRSLGSGFCFNVGRGIAAFAPFVLGTLAASYGLATSIGLCALGFLAAGLVMLALPETPAAGDVSGPSASVPRNGSPA